MTSPEVSRANLEEAGGQIDRLARQMGAKRILVDSISHFERMADDPHELRQTIYGFINGLKREKLTSMLVRESEALLGEADGYEGSPPFVVDAYILLRYVEIDSAIRKALLVLKMRGSNHDKDIRQFEIMPAGIEVQSRFEGREGILSGSPHRMSDSFLRAFVKR
jgi:circadian clock protein KaiC